MTTVDKLRPGERARVATVGGAGAIRQRILDMGLLPEAVIQVERWAPAGDPVWIRLGNAQMSLRRSEAASVTVAVLASS